MDKKGSFIQYYVEGEDEEKILSVLKTDLQLIIPGKISKFNAVQNKVTKARLMNLRPDTTVVLVFDTDTDNADILSENIKTLKAASMVRSIICVTQVRNLAAVLVRHGFEIKQFWVKEPTGVFAKIPNDANLIKI